MRFSDLCEKEVVNVKDCRCLGSVRDLDIDKECGRILALIVPGPGKYLGCFCRDSEFFIPWAKVIRIGPDIILVEFDEKEMKPDKRIKICRLTENRKIVYYKNSHIYWDWMQEQKSYEMSVLQQ